MSVAPRIGLVLTGGGARAAYQVGVLKGLSELMGRPEVNPFAVLSGTSAGAINAAALAAQADHFAAGVDWLYETWRSFHAEQIYRTDRGAVLRAGLRWFGAFAQLYRRNPVSLLDNSPLAALLARQIDFARIREHLAAGRLDALAITVCNYASGASITFFEAAQEVQEWTRPHRRGLRCPLTREHLLASSAIPFIFPAVQLGDDFFGDGSMRQTAPISPALHLGADRVIVVGTGRQGPTQREPEKQRRGPRYPSLAQIAGHAMSSIFLDALEQDIEWLERINALVQATPADLRERMPFREVKALVIAPSEPIELIAARHAYELPRPIQFLLSPLGGMNRGGANMTSYLLFEPGFTQALVELGFNDTVTRRAEVLAFLGRDDEN